MASVASSTSTVVSKESKGIYLPMSLFCRRASFYMSLLQVVCQLAQRRGLAHLFTHHHRCTLLPFPCPGVYSWKAYVFTVVDTPAKRLTPVSRCGIQYPVFPCPCMERPSIHHEAIKCVLWWRHYPPSSFLSQFDDLVSDWMAAGRPEHPPPPAPYTQLWKPCGGKAISSCGCVKQHPPTLVPPLLPHQHQVPPSPLTPFDRPPCLAIPTCLLS